MVSAQLTLNMSEYRFFKTCLLGHSQLFLQTSLERKDTWVISSTNPYTWLTAILPDKTPDFSRSLRLPVHSFPNVGSLSPAFSFSGRTH